MIAYVTCVTLSMIFCEPPKGNLASKNCFKLEQHIALPHFWGALNKQDILFICRTKSGTWFLFKFHSIKVQLYHIEVIFGNLLIPSTFCSCTSVGISCYHGIYDWVQGAPGPAPLGQLTSSFLYSGTDHWSLTRNHQPTDSNIFCDSRLLHMIT